MTRSLFEIITLTAAAEGTTVTIPLTPSGVTYPNIYAGGKAVLGGELAGFDPLIGAPDDPPVFLWGFSSPVIPGVVPWSMGSVTPTPTPMLEVTLIPEPGPTILTFTAAWIFFRRRRVCAERKF